MICVIRVPRISSFGQSFLYEMTKKTAVCTLHFTRCSLLAALPLAPESLLLGSRLFIPTANIFQHFSCDIDLRFPFIIIKTRWTVWRNGVKTVERGLFADFVNYATSMKGNDYVNSKLSKNWYGVPAGDNFSGTLPDTMPITISTTASSSDSGGTRTSDSGGTCSNDSGGTHSNDSGGTRTNDSGGTRSSDFGGTHSNDSGGTHSSDSGGTGSSDSGGAHSNDSGGTRSTAATSTTP